MRSERSQENVTTGEAGTGRPRITRRQAMGRMSAVATAGAAAWVAPEIFLAKPAAGATLSTNVSTTGSAGVSTSPAASGDPGVSADAGVSGSAGTHGPEGATTTAADTAPTALAFTGLDIQRDAEVGAALVAGGWAMQHWASRRLPEPAAAGRSDGHQAVRAGDGD
jgi:hypothetical protein